MPLLDSIKNLYNSFFGEEKSEPTKKTSQEVSPLAVFNVENKIYLLISENNEKYAVPSKDGLTFDFDEKIKLEKHFKADLPSEVDEWDHPAVKHLQPRKDMFDHADITILAKFDMDDHELIVYDTSFEYDHFQVISIGFATYADGEIIWRSHDPAWEKFVKEDEFEYIPLGAVILGNVVYIYFADGENIQIIELNHPHALLEPHKESAHLKRHHQNPIIEPHPENTWESHATLNPAAVLHDGKVHLLYRAHGPDGISVIGYASSEDGYNFERLPHPVYFPRKEFEGWGVPFRSFDPKLMSGGSTHGTEDPRATIIDDRLYMVYAAFNGYEQARLAMTSISLEDFENKVWNWTDPIPVSVKPTVWGTGNKSGALFPEKINGKYVMLHRMWPDICIDYVDDLHFGEGKKFVVDKERIKIRPGHWDSGKVGAGAPPIKTDDGWLLIYQSVGRQDNGKYKIGAMLLDHDNPAKVLYRNERPVLSPSEWYENEGFKYGVTYPCGAVVKDNELLVYYGGSDSFVCVASSPLGQFLDKLKLSPVKELSSVNLNAF